MGLADRSDPDPNTASTPPDTSRSEAEVVLVDAVPAERYVAALRPRYRTVALIGNPMAAIEFLRRATPALVIAGLKANDGAAVAICTTAKSKPIPPSVLVMAERPEDVPAVLAAGCDSVLLKPVSPNLLVNRTARLLQVRSEQLPMLAARMRNRTAHLVEPARLLAAGTNRVWPNARCPGCGHEGATSFDYAAMRRAWYACLQCRKTWLGKRLDS
jgi:DNA-binding NarL/FixJ family response regulator